MGLTFGDLISPISAEVFFRDYFGKQHLHIRASDISSGSRGDLFGWSDLNSILNMAFAWSGKNFHVALDKQMIPAREYCRMELDRNAVESLIPDQTLVMEWLNKGASIILDDMDCLAVGSRVIAGIFQETFSAKVQANLYCSWKQRQAFDVHFDNHDVLAMHFEGEKIWNIYENRVPNPVPHASFQFRQEQLVKMCGGIKEQITLRAGDLLYIPKGQFHDALASQNNAMHIAFGIYGYLGLDFIKDLTSIFVADESFRVPLPLPSQGEGVLREHISDLVEKMSSIAGSEEVFAQVRKAQETHRYPKHDFSLPLDIESIKAKPSVSYAVTSSSFKMAEQNGVKLLVNMGKAMPMPDEFCGAIAWILEVQDFSDEQLVENFFVDNLQKGNKLLQDLVNMGVIAKK